MSGLEGIIATESSISSIIEEQLTYVGYRINDLAKYSSFEETAFLLWNYRLPTKKELAELKEEFANNYVIPQDVIHHLAILPLKKVHPMNALRTGITMLSIFDPDTELMNEAANRRKAIRIQAQMPTLIAAFSRIRKGLVPVQPRHDFGISKNFLYMLSGEEPTELEVQAFDQAAILHADHELNASTFTARVCVASMSDMYSGLISAICSLKGPLHGGANEQVINMLSEISSVDEVEAYIQKKFDKRERIMGFGHRVYRNGDPRALILKSIAKQLCEEKNDMHWYNISVKMEEIVTKAKKIPPNVDFYSATVYHMLNIDHDLFTPIFAMCRASGWLAHILEQYANNRLIRPRANYIGPTYQEYVAIENR